MKTSTKLGLLGIGASIIVSIVFNIVEISESRKGRRRINKKDIKAIADAMVIKQEELKLAKKKAKTGIVKEG